MNPENKPEEGFRLAAAVCAAGVCAFALAALAAWETGYWALAALGQGRIPMPPSLAILMSLLGLGLLLRQSRPSRFFGRWVALGAAAMTIAWSLAVWTASLWGYELPVERWLAGYAVTVRDIPVDRMSPISAPVFLLAALAMLFELPPLNRRRWGRQAAAGWALASLAGAFMALIAYAAGDPLLYSSQAIPMALPTGLGFFGLGIGLLAAAGRDVWPLTLFQKQDPDAPHLQSQWFLGGMAEIFLLVLAATAILFTFYLRYEVKASRRAAEETLNVVADLKTNQVEDWYREIVNDAEYLYETQWPAASAQAFLAASASREAKERFQTALGSIRKNFAAACLRFYGSDGRVKMAEPSTGDQPDHEEAAYVERALASGKIQVSDLHHSLIESGTVNMDVFVPLWAEPGPPNRAARPIGVLMAEIEPVTFLFPFIQSWPSPSPTAETLLVRRDGDEVLFLNTLRHSAQPPLTLRIPLSHTDTPAVMAALGQEGVAEGSDYRGVLVFSALRRVPGTPWFLLAKVDRNEIYAPLRQKVWSASVALLAMIFAGALGVTLLGRKRENQLLHARLTVEIEREQARESLRQQEAFAGALLEHMLEAVVACGADGQLILFNRAAREWHGLDPRNIPQEEWPDYYDLYHADGAAPMAVDDVPLVRAYRGETLRDAGMAIAAKGKPMRYVDANAAPLLDDKNQLLGAVAVMRDITETKTQQEELKRKNEELERFTYTVSHDLKGPLITIKGFSGALQQDIANGKHDRLQGDLARIGTAADKMETLLNDLLNLSRIGRFMNPPIDVDMNRLTQDLLGQLRGPISACDAEVVVQADLPPVHGDSQRIGEVLQNLVENALKFSREGIRPRIEIGARAAKREPIFFVRDHGVGIEPEYHHTIFGLFNKLDNRTEGNGIGLALVQRIIENHQGRIWVESEGRGHGTTFYFTLPAAKPKEKDQAR